MRAALPLVLGAWLLGDIVTLGPLRLVDLAAIGITLVAIVVSRRRSIARLDLAAVLYAVLVIVVELQIVAGRASLDDLFLFLTPGLLVLALPTLVRGDTAVDGMGADLDDGPVDDAGRSLRAVAMTGLVLAIWTLLDAALSLVAHGGDPFAFYAVKVDVDTPLAAHNILASILLVALVAVALRAAEDRRWSVALVVTALALGATLSRGAALVAIAAAAVAALVGAGRRTVGLLGAGAVMALAVVLGGAAVLGADVPDPGGPTSVVSRTQLWRAGLDAIAREPVVGVGVDGFRAVAAEVGTADPRDHTHSVLLQAPATLGVPAGLLYLGLWVLLAWRGCTHPDRRVRSLVLIGGAALFGHGLVDETSLRPSVEVLVAILLAVAAGDGGVGVRTLGPPNGRR